MYNVHFDSMLAAISLGNQNKLLSNDDSFPNELGASVTLPFLFIYDLTEPYS